MAIAMSTAVSSTQAKFQALLEKARQIKQSSAIDPPLSVTELFEDEALPPEGNTALAKELLVAATRNIFYDIVANIDVEDPEFVQMWNLLDILQYYEICGHSYVTVVFSLLEELLDSQNIEACRRVFDYMESRREALIATEFGKKKLIILRLCNELLRRLSRAEDAVFCGRVFIFMFLSFPLGDVSSVNPKGDFHVENVTSFEEQPRPNLDPDKMDVDVTSKDKVKQASASDGKADGDAMKVDGDSTTASAPKQDTAVDLDELYPVFWRLQQAFSNPTRLFDATTFETFKKGLVMTLDKFKQMPVVSTGDKLGVGRKLHDDSDEFASSFNPKYLTSRDLFRLEALILIDFLLSLTEKSKSKLAHLTTQKSLKFSFTLADADAEWASGIKRAIVDYIRSGPDGKFYQRMVEVVLSRDKNWVRWKLENCPEIKRAPVSPEVFVEAKAGAQKACATRRLKAQPMGSLDLRFLSEHVEGSKGLESLKKGERTQIPTLETYISQIQSTELDLEMASGNEVTKLNEAKGNTTWRALRLAARSRLSQFDKVDDGKKMGALIEPPPSAAPITSEATPADGAGDDSSAAAASADTHMQDSIDSSANAAASTSGVADAADPLTTTTNTSSTDESAMAVDADSVGLVPATTAATNETSNGAAAPAPATAEVEVSDATAEQGTASGVPELKKA